MTLAAVMFLDTCGSQDQDLKGNWELGELQLLLTFTKA
jgi:hypothetical protein